MKFKRLFKKKCDGCGKRGGENSTTAAAATTLNLNLNTPPPPPPATINNADNNGVNNNAAVKSNNAAAAASQNVMILSKIPNDEKELQMLQQHQIQGATMHQPNPVPMAELDRMKGLLEDIMKDKYKLEGALEEYVQSNGELELLKKEIQSLKKQRDELQKDILLLQTNPMSKDAGNDLMCKTTKHPNSAPASIAPPTPVGSSEMLDTSDWDKRSSSGSSEISVACLQDRIMQMEETHYSTSEELQATLQELQDLRHENDRLGAEKGALMESLCRQTEKLEDARGKIDTLQQLLLDPKKDADVSSFSEKERKLLELLKSTENEKESSMGMRKELTDEIGVLKAALKASREETIRAADEISRLNDRLKIVENERDTFEKDAVVVKEENFNRRIEMDRLGTLLENALGKIEELNASRDKNADKSQLEGLLDNLREEKEGLASELIVLKERLSKAKGEWAKQSESLKSVQNELKCVKNNGKMAVAHLEAKCEERRAEAHALEKELAKMRENSYQLELRCECYADDKRRLKAALSECRERATTLEGEKSEAEKALEEERSARCAENAEWNQFQSDLLMTVRVANDLKTEAQAEQRKIAAENKRLRDEIAELKAQIQRMKQSETANSQDTSSVSSSVTLRRKLSRQNSRSSSSVKSLIESLENAATSKTGKIMDAEKGVNAGATVTTTTNAAAVIAVAEGESSRETSLSAVDNTVKLSGEKMTEKEGGESEFHRNLSFKENTAKDKFTSGILSNSNMNFNSNKGGTSGNEFHDRKDPLLNLVKNGGSKRNALLKWCQQRTSGYANIDITNFSSSWNDGMAFCALLHSYIPDEVAYDRLNPSDKRENFSIAFNAAESAGIKTSLNVNQMIQQERPDWNEVMAYVTSIFRHFES